MSPPQPDTTARLGNANAPGRARPPIAGLSAAGVAAGVALAIWPVWPWLVRRLGDGADEAWGVLPLLLLAGAIVAELGQVWRRGLAVADSATQQPSTATSSPPSESAHQAGGTAADSASMGPAWRTLVATGLLLLAYAAAYRVAPPLLRGVIGFSALALPMSGLLRRRPFDLAVWGLLMLALPAMASLQFFVGYPLRVVVAQLAALQLRLGGTNVLAAGTILRWEELFVEVDAPCSGVKALWSGALLVCLLAFWLRLSNRRAAKLALGGLAIVVAGNSLRAAALFHLEIAPHANLPGWLHAGVGVIVFAAMALAIAALAGWLEHGGRPATPTDGAEATFPQNRCGVRNADVPGCPVGENAPAGLVPVERRMEIWTALAPQIPFPARPPWRLGGGDGVSAVRKTPSCPPEAGRPLPPAQGRWGRKPFRTASGWVPGRRQLLGAWLAACLVAAGLPLVAPPPRPAPASQPPVWPVEFEGIELIPSRPTVPILAGFPGQATQFTDGCRQILFKQVDRPTRRLHPAADCFRGAGYRTEPGKLKVDRDGRHWSTFTASRQQQSVKVREIVLDANGRSWSTLSAWYWSAIRGRTAPPWLAIVVVEAEGGDGAGR